MFINNVWQIFNPSCLAPLAPEPGIHDSAETQIIWKWHTVGDATGYKWNTVNNFAGAIDMGTATTKTETGLTCNTKYTRFAWAYNTCGPSGSTPLIKSTTIAGAVSVAISVSSNEICSGSTVLFTAVPTNGGPQPFYHWTVNGETVGINSSTYSYAPANNDHVICTLTSNASCVTGNPAISNTIIMTVFPNLPVSLTISPSANPFCAGNSVTFTAMPVNGGSGPLTQWYVNGSVVQGESNPTFTYGPANGDVITCKLYSTVVCPSVYPALSNPIIMTVHTVPVSPSEGIHIPSTDQIEWHWSTVTGAAGYKWNTINDTASAINMGTLTTKTETSLSCSTAYTRYAWAYTSCGNSTPVTLKKTTSINPPAPVSGTQVPLQNVITWHWTTVAGATGYKWNTIDNYATAIDMGTATSKVQTGLICNTNYDSYVWAYNACDRSTPVPLNTTTSVCTGVPCVGIPTVSYGGKTYNTIQLGTQCWFKENLNIGTRINGSLLQTNNSTIEKYCYGDLESNCADYGGLYQWNEMMQYVTTPGVQGICPQGWHIPTDADWSAAASFHGGESITGGKMKSTGTIEDGTGLWHFPNDGATNEYGFLAFPAGYRYYDGGSFYVPGYAGYWWSSSDFGTNYTSTRYIIFSQDNLYKSNYNKDYGFSVRCLHD